MLFFKGWSSLNNKTNNDNNSNTDKNATAKFQKLYLKRRCKSKNGSFYKL